jgi:hypothetical protein
MATRNLNQPPPELLYTRTGLNLWSFSHFQNASISSCCDLMFLGDGLDLQIDLVLLKQDLLTSMALWWCRIIMRAPRRFNMSFPVGVEITDPIHHPFRLGPAASAAIVVTGV